MTVGLGEVRVNGGYTKQVSSWTRNYSQILDYLISSEEEDAEVCQISVKDTGSRAQCVRVDINGVPACGVVDTGADITIMGGLLFKRVLV